VGVGQAVRQRQPLVEDRLRPESVHIDIAVVVARQAAPARTANPKDWGRNCKADVAGAAAGGAVGAQPTESKNAAKALRSAANRSPHAGRPTASSRTRAPSKLKVYALRTTCRKPR